MLKGTANALCSSEKCLMLGYKQAATFIHGKQKPGYRNNKISCNKNIVTSPFTFSLFPKKPDKQCVSLYTHTQGYLFFFLLLKNIPFFFFNHNSPKINKFYQLTWTRIVF